MVEVKNDAALVAGDRYQHRKGGTYEVLGVGAMQASEWCDAVWEVSVDMAPVVIYRSEADGLIWVRPVEEFLDGRFTAVSKASPNLPSASQEGETNG